MRVRGSGTTVTVTVTLFPLPIVPRGQATCTPVIVHEPVVAVAVAITSLPVNCSVKLTLADDGPLFVTVASNTNLPPIAETTG